MSYSSDKEEFEDVVENLPKVKKGGKKDYEEKERIEKHFHKICKAIKDYCEDNSIEIVTAFRHFDENDDNYLSLTIFKKACKKFLKLDYTDKS